MLRDVQVQLRERGLSVVPLLASIGEPTQE
jgi:hypothetical protein